MDKEEGKGEGTAQPGPSTSDESELARRQVAAITAPVSELFRPLQDLYKCKLLDIAGQQLAQNEKKEKMKTMDKEYKVQQNELAKLKCEVEFCTNDAGLAEQLRKRKEIELFNWRNEEEKAQSKLLTLREKVAHELERGRNNKSEINKVEALNSKIRSEVSCDKSRLDSIQIDLQRAVECQKSQNIRTSILVGEVIKKYNWAVMGDDSVQRIIARFDAEQKSLLEKFRCGQGALNPGNNGQLHQISMNAAPSPVQNLTKHRNCAERYQPWKHNKQNQRRPRGTPYLDERTLMPPPPLTQRDNLVFAPPPGTTNSYPMGSMHGSSHNGHNPSTVTSASGGDTFTSMKDHRYYVSTPRTTPIPTQLGWTSPLATTPEVPPETSSLYHSSFLRKFFESTTTSSGSQMSSPPGFPSRSLPFLQPMDIHPSGISLLDQSLLPPPGEPPVFMYEPCPPIGKPNYSTSSSSKSTVVETKPGGTTSKTTTVTTSSSSSSSSSKQVRSPPPQSSTSTSQGGNRSQGSSNPSSSSSRFYKKEKSI